MQGVKAWLIDDPDALSHDASGGGVVPAQKLMNLMQHAEHADELMDWLDHGRNLTDLWGHPVQIQFQKLNSTNYLWKVTIWSFGPNGIDDSGGVDDILVSGLAAPVNAPGERR
jgi:hypothetical protein